MPLAGFASVLKWIFLIICLLCHFYYLFCCLAHTEPELDFGPYIWKARCSLFSYTSCSVNKTVPLKKKKTEWLITALGDRAETDNLLKMSHFCARLGTPWLNYKFKDWLFVTRGSPARGALSLLTLCILYIQRAHHCPGNPQLISEPTKVKGSFLGLGREDSLSIPPCEQLRRS